MECSECGGRVVVRHAGRPPKFCSTRCRMRAHRAARRIPADLTALHRWTRADGKRPVTVKGRSASSTDPATWTTYASVRRSKAGDGFGIMLGEGLACYDLDKVSDDEAREFIEKIPEPIIYAERSMSGRGVHVFVEASESAGWRRRVDGISVEFYSRARFIRMTGRRFV